MPLDTFTVNLVTPDNNPDRVLYIGLTLRLPDESTRRQLNDFLPEVRSRLLMLLSRQEASQLANEQGKQRLVAQIKDVLSPPLVKDNRSRWSAMCCSPPSYCGNHYGRQHSFTGRDRRLAQRRQRG